MAVVQFGNSWWGAKWLDALEGCDYSNRLPRGKTYARNGSVLSVKLNAGKVSASVHGSRPEPYKVHLGLKKFTKKDEALIVAAATQDPFVLSQLVARRMPTALNELLIAQGAPLFPNSWEDVKAHCSCPDWAFCCKHIAAIIYLIAGEVDQNPFRLFELRGFDLLDALDNSGQSVRNEARVTIECPRDKIISTPLKAAKMKNGASLDARIPGHPDESSPGQNALDFRKIDFTKIPPSRTRFLSLLTEWPVFYPQKDFKLVLNKALKSYGAQITREGRHASTASSHGGLPASDTVYSSISIKLDDNLQLASMVLRRVDGNVIVADRAAAPEFRQAIRSLLAIPQGKYANHDANVVVASLAARFAFRLLEQGAVLPEIIELDEGCGIRWAPALMEPSVQVIFSALCNLATESFIETPALEVTDQVFSFISIILGSEIANLAADDRTLPDDTVSAMFFMGEPLNQSTRFGASRSAQSIGLWLSRFHIAHKNFVPVVKINETKNGFSMELMVEDRRPKITPPIPLKKILTQKKYAGVKLDILGDIVSLTDHMPEIGEFVASGGADEPQFSAQAFEAVLFERLPALKLLQIPILLPKGLDNLIRPKIAASIETKNKNSATSYLSLDDMLKFEWHVAIGNERFSAEEFSKLVRACNGIVKLKNQYVYLDEKDIAKILKGLDRDPALNAKDIFQAVVSEDYNGARLTLSKGARQQINQLLKIQRLEVPIKLCAELREYQHRGFEWLVRNSKLQFGSLIADDMGLGKTIQVITLLLHLSAEGAFGNQTALIIVPTALLTNWCREFEKFAPDLNVAVYHGTTRRLNIENADVVLTTYGLLRRDEEKFVKTKWAAVIIDEAQAIKNPSAGQTKSIKKLKSDVRIAMTGTPVENRLSEYWSIIDFLNKGYLKGAKAFQSDFAIPIEADRNQEKLEKFRKITAPFILRRLKTDKSIIQDLPEKIEIDQYCTLEKRQAALYVTTTNQIMAMLEGTDDTARRGIVLKLINALKQVCNHPGHYLKKQSIEADHAGKTKLLLGLLRPILDNGEKTLIFTQYKEMGALLQGLLEKQFSIAPLFLHGGLSRKKRDAMVDDFQSKPHAKIMILSLKAGGVGLNLTAAQNVIHYDLWWNPAVEAQATDRAFRIGQTKNVMVYRFITRGTFEEKINEMLTAKKELADLTVSTGEKWIGEYSNDELREMFALTT